MTLVRINAVVADRGRPRAGDRAAPRLSVAVLAASLVPTTARRPPVLERDRPRQRRPTSRSTSSRTSRCWAACCSPPVDTEGKPGVAWRARRAATRRTPRGQAPAAAGRPPRGQAGGQAQLPEPLDSLCAGDHDPARRPVAGTAVRAARSTCASSLPGSKSLTNRALVLAALADGPSVVRRALRSRDTKLMAAALTALGSTVDTSGDDWPVTPGAVRAATPPSTAVWPAR